MFCNSCGKQLKDGAQFCNSCGAKVKKPQAVQPNQDQTFAPNPNVTVQPGAQNQNTVAYQAQVQPSASDGNKGLILGLSIAGAVIIIAIAVLIIFLLNGDKIFPKNETKNEVKTETSDSDKKSKSNNNNNNKDEDYILLDSDRRYMTDAQLEGLSTYDLYLARNEIYARHGRDFKKDDLKKYFASKSWYHVQYTPEYFDAHTSTLLNDYERKNAEKMLAIEKSRNSPYLAP